MLRHSSLCLAIVALIAFPQPMSVRAASKAPEKCVAVFEFELIDSSLEGEIKGIDSAEQQRLGLLGEQLRTWLAAHGRRTVCDMSAVAAEAKAANLYACGCIQRLASSAGGELAVVGAVHKVSNLILNITVDVFDVETGKRLIQLNADIRSNSDRSWTRGLDWLIKHRLAGVLASVEGSKL